MTTIVDGKINPEICEGRVAVEPLYFRHSYGNNNIIAIGKKLQHRKKTPLKLIRKFLS